jgi:hypothetical protein
LFKQQLKKNEPVDYGITESGGDFYRTDPRHGTVELIRDNPDAPEKPTPDMQNFQFDKANGYEGSFHDWMREKSAKPPGGDIQNYEYARANGFKGSFEDWTKLKDPMVQVNTGDVGGDDKELSKAFDKKEGESWVAIQEAGAVSGAMNQDFEVLDRLATIAPQSPLTGPFLQAFPGLSTTGAAFQSIVKRVAPSLRTAGSGATSDIEYEGFLQSMPSLSNYPEANQLISEVMKAKQALNIDRADVVTAWRNKEISSKDARSKLAELNRRSILSPKMKSLLDAQGAKDPSEMSDEELLKTLGGE